MAKQGYQFQITEWFSNNEPLYDMSSEDAEDADEPDGDEDDAKRFVRKELIIYCFGVTETGQKIAVKLTDFQPFFYIRVPKKWGEFQIRVLINRMKSDIYPKEYADELHDWKILQKHQFRGFDNFQKHQFVKLIFTNFEAFLQFERLIKSYKSGKKKKPVIEHMQWPSSDKHDLILYESNIEPLIRCIHLSKCQSAGWSSISKFTINKNPLFISDIDITANWKDLRPVESEAIAPIDIASFDIEAKSSHGDFPISIKNYVKLYQDIVDQMHYLKNRFKSFVPPIPWNKVKSQFENKHYIESLIDQAFSDEPNYHVETTNPSDYITDNTEIHHIFTKKGKVPLEETKKRIANNVYPYYKHLFAILHETETFDATKYTQQLEYKILEIYNEFQDPQFLQEFALWIEEKLTTVTKIKYKEKSDIDYMQLLSITLKIIKFANMDPTKKEDKVKTINNTLQRVRNIGLKKKLPKNDFKRIIEHIRDFCKEQILSILDSAFPAIEGDIVIQIGMTTKTVGNPIVKKYIATLKSCDQFDPTVTIESFKTERDVILGWAKHVQKENPDIITGWNIFGFDFEFIWNRAKELHITEPLSKLLTRIKRIPADMHIKQLCSSGLGDNILKILEMPGRISMDLMKVIQKDHRLDSYKLDFVANHFMKGQITGIKIYNHNKHGKVTHLTTTGFDNLELGNYVNIQINNGIYVDQYKNGKKYKILRKEPEKLVIQGAIRAKLAGGNLKIFWCECKDDIKPEQIFAYQDQGSDKRAIIAKYCLQDCELVTRLVEKLDVVVNNIGMANVCYVPLSYLFLRGQGVKSYSLVSRECRISGYLIPTIRAIEDFRDDPDIDDSYEGAIVLEPKTDLYFEPATAVCDFNSLYPSCIIAEDASHDTIVLDDEKYGNLPGYTYNIVEHNVLKGKGDKKVVVGKKAVKYVKLPEGRDGIIPRILKRLLQARKDVRNKQANVKDKFKWSILEGLQLAYKITANSMYGQLGAKTSPIFLKDLAATTTASGQKNLLFARDFFLKWFTPENLPKFIEEYQSQFTPMDYCKMGFANPKQIEELGIKTRQDMIDKQLIFDIKADALKAPVVAVYGDTDSVFMYFKTIYEKHMAVYAAIQMAREGAFIISRSLKRPNNLELEKAIWPFILLSKKRYVGHYFTKMFKEQFYLQSMGIVLKRRDNAPIVKVIYGNVIKILMERHDVEGARQYVAQFLRDLLAEKFKLKKFIISKTLRAHYANPDAIAHKVLATRMAIRDPGNKPQVNDRIQFAYIVTDNKIALQGDRIEHPDYIKKNGLRIDYSHYITNQIMKPVCQIFALVDPHPEQMFTDALRECDNKKKGLRTIDTMFKATESCHKAAREHIIQRDIHIGKENNLITNFFKSTGIESN